MKKLILSLLVIAAFVVAPMSLFAQNSASATVKGGVSIIAPITITAGDTLGFGVVALGPGGIGGTVTILPTVDVPTATGVSTTLLGTTRHADFAITGDKNHSFGITYGGDATPAGVLTLATGLTVALNGEGASNALLNTAKLSSEGAYTLNLGGVLTVPANMASGVYSKNVSVTVTYN